MEKHLTFEGIEISDSDVHPQKALEPIDVNLSEGVTQTIFVLFLNAFGPI